MEQATSYLDNLAVRLVAGLAKFPDEFRSRNIGYLTARQNPDGGFSGREGESDLYYTSFALRSLAVLLGLTPEICTRAGAFLSYSLNRQTSVVDFFSFLYSCLLLKFAANLDVLKDSASGWPERVAATLETFRTADGGYGKVPGANSGSTYHTFLVGLTYQMLEQSIPHPQETVQFVLSRQRDDGGFVEIRAMRHGGTNPTAAAIGLLQLIESDGRASLTQEVRQRTIEFLLTLPSEEGGFRAKTRAPLADALSTFTGLWTLEQLGASDRISKEKLLRYAEALELSSGGFRGGLWDDGTDVEYTFYGLGTLALLT
jgi:geranylgeranyl transferase type-2 subunit beta